MSKKFEKGKMVPVPSHAIIPERDIDKSPILECSHLGIDFGGLRAVNDFNLTIGRTEIAGLIGPNGAGKTTIFNLLTKVYQPTRGTILLDGLDTSGKTTAQINALCGAVEKAMKEQAGEDPLRREGYRDGTWVLLDYGCVVVHVFSAEAREFYSLERLWHDGKPVDLSGVLTEN